VNIGRRVVLKLLRKDIAADPRVEERFNREARACAAVAHPNITTIYEVNRHEGLWYICMEYVEGRTLRSLLRNKGLIAIDDAIRFAAATADALAAAHDRGIVHRDIKPENIMVMPDGAVKVLDFGLAAFTSGALEPFEIGSMKTVEACRCDWLWRAGMAAARRSGRRPGAAIRARGGADRRAGVRSGVSGAGRRLQGGAPAREDPPARLPRALHS
jgi:serine/threonine protein kinase